MAAVALLLNVSLITPYVTGYDVQGEYFFATLVSTSGVWNATIPSDYNTVLSVAMLAPIISAICNLSIAVVFKWIYQVFFAFVPLGLYLYIREANGSQSRVLVRFLFCFNLFVLCGDDAIDETRNCGAVCGAVDLADHR